MNSSSGIGAIVQICPEAVFSVRFEERQKSGFASVVGEPYILHSLLYVLRDLSPEMQVFTANEAKNAVMKTLEHGRRCGSEKKQLFKAIAGTLALQVI